MLPKDEIVNILNAYAIVHGAARVKESCQDWLNERRFGKKSVKRKKLSPSQKAKLYAKQDGKCNRCYNPFPIRDLTDDHIVALSRNGTNDFKNRQLLCQPCNSSKGNNILTKEAKVTGKTVSELLEGK